MRRRVAAVGFTLSLLSAALLATSAVAGRRVHVSPGAGGPSTHFVVRFRAPSPTGDFGSVRSHYQLYASGPRGPACVSGVSIRLRATKRYAHVRLTLNPKRLGGVWCAGRFSGRIEDIQAIVCKKDLVCRNVMIAPQTIARFSFRVKPAPAGGGGGTGGGDGPQTTGPTFSGLQSATTCSPVRSPSVEPRIHTYTLSWSPATDPVTPSSEIVYDVYYSSTPGGEDFSTPSYTTPAGATTYTMSIPGAAAYFVVRARDQAGLEDHNMVEHVAVLNMC